MSLQRVLEGHNTPHLSFCFHLFVTLQSSVICVLSYMRFLFLLLSFSPCHVGILYCLASQGMGMKQQPLEELMIMTTTTTSPSTASSIGISTRPPPPQVAERKARPQKEALNCPRCNSTNTKFCYYNNYSLTQPRYFCKTCRRYWTEGGSLRNVPVGGGSRKNKKHSSSSSSSSKNLPLSCQGLNNPPPAQPLPISLANNQSSRSYQGQDLNLAFPAASHSLPECGGGGGGGGGMSAMELLRSGMSARGLGPLVSMPMPMPMVPESGLVYGAGFGLQELRPSAIKFPLDAGYESMQLFPFGELKQVAVKASEVEESRVQGGEPPMFWNGMMGGSGGGGGGGGSW